MEKEGNTSVDKTLKILLSFAPYNQEQGTVEISQKLGFHTATVSRNLQILTEYGFLNKNPKSKRSKGQGPGRCHPPKALANHKTHHKHCHAPGRPAGTRLPRPQNNEIGNN